MPSAWIGKGKALLALGRNEEALEAYCTPRSLWKIKLLKDAPGLQLNKLPELAQRLTPEQFQTAEKQSAWRLLQRHDLECDRAI